MNEVQSRSAAEKMRIATRVGELEQQLVEQNAAIQILERRLSAAARPLRRFSFARLHEVLAIEMELSAPLEKRGTLVYDRDFVLATSGA